MRKGLILGLFCIMFCFTGCYNEDELTATEGLEFHYTVPQGQSEDADPRIVEYFETYGFYILYDFREAAMFWNNTSWGGGVAMRQGNPAYANAMLDLIEDAFFNYWPERYMKYLPMKVLLCSQLDDMNTCRPTGGEQYTSYTRINLWEGFDNIALNGCSAEIDTMTLYSKGRFQAETNAYMLRLLLESGEISVPQEFIDADALGYAYQGFWQNSQTDSMFSAGYLNSQTLTTDVQTSAENDFRYYLDLAAMPLEILEGEPAVFNYDDLYLRTEPPLWGCMNSARDPWGRIRAKYNAMIDYLREQGFPVDVWQSSEHLKD